MWYKLLLYRYNIIYLMTNKILYVVIFFHLEQGFSLVGFNYEL